MNTRLHAAWRGAHTIDDCLVVVLGGCDARSTITALAQIVIQRHVPLARIVLLGTVLPAAIARRVCIHTCLIVHAFIR